jgi:ABC-type thiamine transport system ATPase subunit
MPQIDIVVSSPIEKSFRVDQVAGMFDLKLAKSASSEFHAEVPAIDEDWQIGVIVGPSGSGKSTIARQAFGDLVVGAESWPDGKAVVDGFGDHSIKEITHALTSVGFSSPPSWVKPYAVLSNGEKFRCDLARSLLSDRPAIVFDEFTSVVDRTVAKIGSAAVSKAIRKGRITRKFVAVTCHYDVVDWLEPDWVLDMASGRLARGRLRRPQIQLEIAPVFPSAWNLFRRHHYLNTSLSPCASCFCAFIGEEPVAFSAWIHAMTRNRQSGDMREHRTVVLPDYQGVGIGNRLSEYCASIWVGLGGKAFSTTSHPSMIRYRSASPLWNRRRLSMAAVQGKTGIFYRNANGTTSHRKVSATSSDRMTGGFQYVGPPLENADRFRLKPNQMIIAGLIERYPGATIPFLRRRSGLASGVDSSLAVLENQKIIVRRSAGKLACFYPATEYLSE